MGVIKGEYWITDGGLLFANGDIGDMNHEGFVLQQARGDLLSLIGADNPNGTDDIDEDSLNEKIQEYLAEQSGDEDADFSAFTLDELKKAVAADSGKHDELINAAFDKTDLRSYAMREWDWVWVRGDSATAWRLDKDTLENISSGVGDILESEGIEIDDPDLTETEIHISSALTGKSISLSFADLDAKEFSGGQTSHLFESKGSAAVRKLDEESGPEFYRGRNE